MRLLRTLPPLKTKTFSTCHSSTYHSSTYHSSTYHSSTYQAAPVKSTGEINFIAQPEGQPPLTLPYFFFFLKSPRFQAWINSIHAAALNKLDVLNCPSV